jgi:hypothetical protein
MPANRNAVSSPRVRFLKADEIDLAVSDLLHEFANWSGRAIAAPIPVEDILEKYLRITLEIRDLVECLGVPDVLGAAWFNENLVRVDRRVVDQEGRFCFTIGHELGHWVLHRPQVEAERVAPVLFAGTESLPAVVCRATETKAPAEWQADQFSARLLMPAPLVRAAFVSACGEGPIEIDGLRSRGADRSGQARWREVATSVISEGKFSNVSNEAMRYRLSDLDLVTDGRQAVLFR